MGFIAESVEGRAAQQVLKRRTADIEHGNYVEPEAELQEHLVEKGWDDPADEEFRKDLAGDFAGVSDGTLVYWESFEKEKFPKAKREELASKGHALSDGSYPIEKAADLENAINLAQSGHGNVPAAMILIKRRAKELDVTDKLPQDWAS